MVQSEGSENRELLRRLQVQSGWVSFFGKDGVRTCSSADLTTAPQVVVACAFSFRAAASLFSHSQFAYALQIANVEKVFSLASEKAKLQIRGDNGSRSGIAGRRASVA
eukprot:SAG31_NODE_12886_length_909_cov_0.829630_2_plen_107_part_01